jgi:hypothetical protein
MDLTTTFRAVRANASMASTFSLARSTRLGRNSTENWAITFFNCGINGVLFQALGVSDQEFLDAVRSSPDDAGVIAWMHDVPRPDRSKLNAMNDMFEHMEPQTVEQKRYFDSEVASTGTKRTDIKTFADMLDLQEGRLPI